MVRKFNLNLTKRLLLAIFSLVVMFSFDLTANAQTSDECFKEENVGASVVFNTKAYNNASTERLGIDIPVSEEINSKQLVMVALTSTLNVRSEGSIDAEIVGRIYRDCGGLVLERGDEWSLIESGDLVGWCSNEYLLFDEEATALARDVGSMTATVTSSCIPVYDEADDSSRIIWFASEKTMFEVIREEDDGWVLVAYDEYEGYVKSEHVEIEFVIDHGETMDVIRERKRKAAEEKKKLIHRNEAIAADGDTLKVLATIIWCEARGESYEGQLAVGSVVMNRVRSRAYPDTVYDVVFASGQFSPVKSGYFQRAYENNLANASTYKAAEEVINGYTNVGDMTHFRRKGNRDGYIIGNHVFY